MKNAGAKKTNNHSSIGKSRDDLSHSKPQEQAAHYEMESEILLALSNAITKVREKDDLIEIFKQQISGLFPITHSIVTLVDEEQQTYFPFLLDKAGSPIRTHERYMEMVNTHYTMNEPFIQTVLKADDPV